MLNVPHDRKKRIVVKSDPNQTSWHTSTRTSTSRVLVQNIAALVAVRVAAVLVAIALGRAAPVVAIPVGGVSSLGDGYNSTVARGGGSRGNDRGLESGGRSADGAGSGNSGRESGVAGGRLDCDGRGCRRSSAVIVVIARAESDSDGSVRGTGLHAVGIVSGVAVSLLLGSAGSSVGSDLPISVPGVAVNLAQVVPDSSIVLEGVLVLENVGKGSAVGELDGPAVAVGELGPLLGVAVGRRQSLVDLRVTTIGRGNVGQSNIVAALVDNNSASNRLGSSGGHQGGSSVNRVLHFDDWGVFLLLSRTVEKSRFS